MELIQAVLYGLVQGLTEWLPISSTAHLRLLSAFSGWTDPGAGFTAVIQLGTLLAVLVYFGKDLLRIAAGWFHGITDSGYRDTQEFRMGNGMIIGSIPILVLGFLLKDKIESDWRSLYVIAIALIVMGVVLAVSEMIGSKRRSIDDAKLKDGIWIGLWQAIALIPGASRSGSTISGALFAGFDRNSAARYSFLLSTPSVLAAGIYSMYRHRSEFAGEMITSIAVANVVSFVVGLASIALFMKIISKSGSMAFVAYRVVLGIVILVLLQTGRVQADAGIPKHPDQIESK